MGLQSLPDPAGSSWLAADRQSHLWIDYVHALYALMEKTAKTYPKTELMLCSGGGGRVDYGALRYFTSSGRATIRTRSCEWPCSGIIPISFHQ